MKKRLAAVVCGVLTAAMVMTGCQASKGLKTNDIEITQYKDVEVDEVDKPEEVTDEDVDNYIQSTLASYAETQDITDRAVQEGDTVNIDFVGTMDGVAFDGGTAQGVTLTIGSGQMIPGFEESIIGHNTGETLVWDGAFPDEYQNNPDLAGKACQFSITVNSITVQTTPELNDEQVQKMSDKSKTVDEYKEEVKKDLEDSNEQNYQSSLRSAVWNVVIGNTTVKNYPQDKIDEMKNSLIDQYKTYAEAMGTTYEEYIESSGQMKVEDFEKQVEDAAKESQKQTMALRAIADKEKIKIDDDTYKEQLDVLSENTGMDTETLEKNYDKETLEDAMLDTLVKDWLVEHCIQVKSK